MPPPQRPLCRLALAASCVRRACSNCGGRRRCRCLPRSVASQLRSRWLLRVQHAPFQQGARSPAGGEQNVAAAAAAGISSVATRRCVSISSTAQYVGRCVSPPRRCCYW